MTVSSCCRLPLLSIGFVSPDICPNGHDEYDEYGDLAGATGTMVMTGVTIAGIVTVAVAVALAETSGGSPVQLPADGSSPYPQERILLIRYYGKTITMQYILAGSLSGKERIVFSRKVAKKLWKKQLVKASGRL